MNKITLKNPTDIKLGKDVTVVHKAAFVPAVKELDPAKVKWLDDPNAQTLTVQLANWREVLVMGDPAKTTALTPYSSDWTDETAWAAFLKQVNVNVDENNVGTVAAAS